MSGFSILVVLFCFAIKIYDGVICMLVLLVYIMMLNFDNDHVFIFTFILWYFSSLCLDHPLYSSPPSNLLHRENTSSEYAQLTKTNVKMQR